MIQDTFDEEQDLRQMKNTFFISQIHCCHGENHAQVVLPSSLIRFPMLEERVNTLTNQVILLISHFYESANKSVEMAVPDDEVDGFLSPKQERESKRRLKGERHAYLSLHYLSCLMGQ